jgi:hypothetical protein
MSESNTVIASTVTEIGIEGRAELAKTLLDLKAKAKAVDRAKAERQEKHARLVELQRTKNPQILPDSLRPANPGESVNGKPAKGWLCQIRCATCGKPRTVNTQDAFQARFCQEHVKDAAKDAAKSRRENAKVQELLSLDPDQLKNQIEEMERKLAANS